MTGSDFSCPDCGGLIFRARPARRQNIECVGCGSRFNVAHWRGLLISAERIPNDSEWREDVFPKVLQ